MSIKNKKITSLCILVFVLFAFNLPSLLVFAADYQLLEPSIIIDKNSSQPSSYTLKDYLRTAYMILFIVVIAVTILFFIVGGLQYIMSDIPMVKSGGMKQLQSALLGLGLALISYLLLKIVNPDLVNLDFNFNLPA